MHACNWDEGWDEDWVAGMRTGMIAEFEKMPHKTARKKTGRRAQDTYAEVSSWNWDDSSYLWDDSSWYWDDLDFLHPT